MSKLELIVLGFINRDNIYGYEIVKFFKDTGFYEWMKIKLPSIYKVLSRLEKKELIEKKRVYQDDGIPKNEFSITQKGKEEFPIAMKNYLTNQEDAHFFEFIFFTLLIKQSVTRKTFLKALQIHIDKIKDTSEEKKAKHDALRAFFPEETFISPLIGNHFKTIKEQYLSFFENMKEKAMLPENDSYFMQEEHQ